MSLRPGVLFHKRPQDFRVGGRRRASIGGAEFRHYAECAEALSPTELLVTQALIMGMTTHAQLAKALGISARTVQTHLAHIFDKLFISNKVELCLYALRAHWFDCYGNPTNADVYAALVRFHGAPGG